MYSAWNPVEGFYETCRVFLSNQCFYVIQMLSRSANNNKTTNSS